MGDDSTSGQQGHHTHEADVKTATSSQGAFRSVKPSTKSSQPRTPTSVQHPIKQTTATTPTSGTAQPETNEQSYALRDDSSSTNDVTASEPLPTQENVALNDGTTPLSTATDSVTNTKKKAARSSPRIGQACDRCKVRKIKCDAQTGGCSACVKNNVECKTTDPITGRSTSRGHTQRLDEENTALRRYILEMQQQLREAGVEPEEAPEGLSIG